MKVAEPPPGGRRVYRRLRRHDVVEPDAERGDAADDDQPGAAVERDGRRAHGRSTSRRCWWAPRPAPAGRPHLRRIPAGTPARSPWCPSRRSAHRRPGDLRGQQLPGPAAVGPGRRRAGGAPGAADRHPRPLHPVAGLCWPWTSTPTPSARCRRSRDVVFLDAGRSRYPGWWPEPVRVPRPGGLLAVDDVLSHRDQVADLPRIAADPRLAAAGSRSGRPWCSPSRGPGRQPSSHRRQRAGSRTDHRTARTGRPAAARARCPATCTTMRCRSA
ncbi:MAG: putative O-methyltransferase [Modestobacter sp.]|jgi:hypothetical protein|nr:putative O-methyltransferase [Modestobacter sp.]